MISRSLCRARAFGAAAGVATLMLVMTGLAPVPARAQSYSTSELERLVAPIALYPDPLIAELLPAATYPDEVADAADYVAAHGATDKAIDKQPWDASIKAIARYPDALNKMADDMDWTADLGDAFLAQPGDVMDAIQTCRGVAKDRGVLTTNDKQTVVYEEQNIRVVPTTDTTIYVPQYEPQVVYIEDDDDGPSWGGAIAASAISFGVGMAVGSWFDNDCDWYGGGVYHAGWYGGGYPSWNSYRSGNVNINGDVNFNRQVNNYNNVNNWRHDSNRYQNDRNRYGDKYNDRYRDQNRAQNKDKVRNDRMANSNRNNASTRDRQRNNAQTRDRAATRDLTKQGQGTRDANSDRAATTDRNRDRTAAANTSRDAQRERARATANERTGKTPAPDRAKRDAVNRQDMDRQRQQREVTDRGRQSADTRQRDSANRQRAATKPAGYERGSEARKQSDRGLQSRQQSNPRAGGAFGGGGSRPQPKASGGNRGGGGGGGRGGGGGGGGRSGGGSRGGGGGGGGRRH